LKYNPITLISDSPLDKLGSMLRVVQCIAQTAYTSSKRRVSQVVLLLSYLQLEPKKTTDRKWWALLTPFTLLKVASASAFCLFRHNLCFKISVLYFIFVYHKTTSFCRRHVFLIGLLQIYDV
jgi:hypothetical protein